MELGLGTTLEGGWKITRVLGHGACSTVYSACHHGDVKHVKAVAVKVFKSSDQYVDAGINELHMLQKLRALQSTVQQYFVTLHDFVYSNDHLCIIMELLTCNLYHITLKACPEEPIPLYVIQNCCRDLGQALDCLRTLGIIHGDIKPTNIMWNPVKEVFILGDFGLSFYEGKQPLQPIQSAGYQAPEVMRWNSKLKDPANLEDMAVKGCGLASDMWSLGCLLYFLYKRQHLPALPWQQSCNNCMQGKTCHSLCDVFEPQCPTNKTSILIQDLLARALKCSPAARITPDALLSHPFLQGLLQIPSLSDLLLLPTKVLQLTNMFADASELIDSEEDYEDFVKDIREKCSTFGDVTSLRIPYMESKQWVSCMGKVFVVFEDASACELAAQSLTGITFNCRTVISSYFPLREFCQNRFY